MKKIKFNEQLVYTLLLMLLTNDSIAHHSIEDAFGLVNPAIVSLVIAISLALFVVHRYLKTQK